MMKRILVFAVVAMMLITPLDALQVVGGVRTLGSRTWATPLEFAAVGCLLALATRWIDQRPRPETRWSVAIDAALFGAGYVMTLLDPLGASLEVFIFLCAVLTIQLIRYKSIWRDAVPLMLLLALAGPTTEATLVHLGTFEYKNNILFGVPYWLPLLWGSGGFLAQSLSGEIRHGTNQSGRDGGRSGNSCADQRT